MSHKIQPHGLRLGVNKTWSSLWFANGASYAKQVHEDLKIRKYVEKVMSIAGLGDVIVKRSENSVDVDIYVARPGVAIGRGGSSIDDLKKQIEKITHSNVTVRINEVKKPDLSARIVAKAIADGISRRMPQKMMMSSYKEKVMQAGADGVKISIGGRIGGQKQARTIKVAEGRIPLHTLRANIDYAEERAEVPNLCTFGVKVWIYMDKKSE